MRARPQLVLLPEVDADKRVESVEEPLEPVIVSHVLPLRFLTSSTESPGGPYSSRPRSADRRVAPKPPERALLRSRPSPGPRIGAQGVEPGHGLRPVRRPSASAFARRGCKAVLGRIRPDRARCGRQERSGGRLRRSRRRAGGLPRSYPRRPDPNFGSRERCGDVERGDDAHRLPRIGLDHDQVSGGVLDHAPSRLVH